jgi:SPP1 gp7 family putative phage head morphogenesis protein
LRDISFKRLRGDFALQVDRVITQGLIQGHSYPKMAKAIKEMVVERNATDAVRIARTEGHRAAVQGALDNYDEARELGVECEQIWDATLDGKTRPEHGALDGKPAQEHNGELMWHATAPDGQDIWTPGPGLSGNASMDINCRCRVRGQIDDYGPKVRRMRDEGLRDYITYDDWIKEKK